MPTTDQWKQFKLCKKKFSSWLRPLFYSTNKTAINHVDTWLYLFILALSLLCLCIFNRITIKWSYDNCFECWKMGANVIFLRFLNACLFNLLQLWFTRIFSPSLHFLRFSNHFLLSQIWNAHTCRHFTFNLYKHILIWIFNTFFKAVRKGALASL